MLLPAFLAARVPGDLVQVSDIEFRVDLGAALLAGGHARSSFIGLRTNYNTSIINNSVEEKGTKQIGDALVVFGTPEIGISQVSLSELGGLQFGSTQVGSEQGGTEQLSTAQVGSSQFGTTQVSSSKWNFGQIGTAQINPSKISFPQDLRKKKELGQGKHLYS